MNNVAFITGITGQDGTFFEEFKLNKSIFSFFLMHKK